MQLEDYISGTVSIANGSTSLSGSGTAWKTAALKAGDIFYKSGYAILIASVEDENAITLADAWPGTTLSDVVYAIRFAPDNSRVQGTTRQLLDQWRQGIYVTPDAIGTLAGRDDYDDQPEGFKYLADDSDPWKLYAKLSNTSGDWSTGTSWGGPQGDRGLPGSSDVVGTSVSSVAIGTGAKTFAIVEADRGWGVGARLRGSSDADAANFVEGPVTSYADNSLTLDVDLTGGSGTFGDWTFNLAGKPGEDADVSSGVALDDGKSVSWTGSTAALKNNGNGLLAVAESFLISGTSGSAGHSEPNFILRSNDTVTPDGAGGWFRFQSPNDAGTMLDSLGLNGGLVDATAGAEQSLLDIGGYRMGIAETMLTIFGGAIPSITPGSTNGIYNLGATAQQWKNFYGKGIALNGGSLLDTYQEGTFTPELQFSGASTGITYSTQSGVFRRIGKFLFVQARIVLTNKGTATGNASISLGASFPYTISAGSGIAGIFSNLASAGAVTYDVYSKQADIYYASTTGSVRTTNANFTDTSNFGLAAMCYVV